LLKASLFHFTSIFWGLSCFCEFSGYNQVCMTMYRTTVRIIALLVMLSLPLQSLASVLLPCLHAGDTSVTQPAFHPCHLTSEPADEAPAFAGECHKCQLCLMLSGSALLADEQTSVAGGNSTYFLLPVDHFYNFSPGLLQRPPSRITSI
jgi:hypothetical protein